MNSLKSSLGGLVLKLGPRFQIMHLDYLNDGYLFIALLVIDCAMLMPPSNGRLDINPSTTAPGGFMATYFCDEGYDLVGNSSRVCQVDGSWTGSDPNCARKLNTRAVST